MEYKSYTENFNDKINSIVDTLQSKYPNLTEKEIVDILNSNDSLKESTTLRKYGMGLDDKSIISKNDSLYSKYLFLNIIVLIFGFLIIFILFMMYQKS